MIFLISFPHTQADVKLPDVSYRPRLCEFSFQNIVQQLGLVMVFTLITYWTLKFLRLRQVIVRYPDSFFEDVMKFTFISIHRPVNFRVKLCPSFIWTHQSFSAIPFPSQGNLYTYYFPSGGEKWVSDSVSLLTAVFPSVRQAWNGMDGKINGL